MSTFLKPVNMLINIGKKQVIKISITFGNKPKPNHKTISGAIEIVGMDCETIKIGDIILFKILNLSINTANAKAIKILIKRPNNASKIVACKCQKIILKSFIKAIKTCFGEGNIKLGTKLNFVNKYHNNIIKISPEKFINLYFIFFTFTPYKKVQWKKSFVLLKIFPTLIT